MSVAPLPVQFSRITAQPIETNTIFSSVAEAQTYANSPIAIISQAIKVVTPNIDDPIRTFEIQRDRSLKEITVGELGMLDHTIVAKQTVGGIREGDSQPEGLTVEERWERLLGNIDRPKITNFSATPAFGLKEVGVMIHNIIISATIVKTDNNVLGARIVKLPENIIINENWNMPDGGIITAHDSTGINRGIRTYKVETADVKGFGNCSSNSFEFVYPAIIGSKNKDELTQPEILNLNRILTNRANVDYTSTEMDVHIFAYFPTSWGMPTMIRDQSNLNLMESFQHFTVSSLPFGGDTQNYNGFRTINRIYRDKYKISFIFE